MPHVNIRQNEVYHSEGITRLAYHFKLSWNTNMTLTIRKRKMIYKLKRWNVLCIIPTSQLTTRVPELYENLSPTQKLKLNFPIKTILMQFRLKTNQTKPKRFMARFHSHHFSTKSSTFSGHFYPKKSHTKCACPCQMSQSALGRKRLGDIFTQRA